MTPAADARPRYEQVADDIARQIADGTYTADSALPGQRALAERYGTAKDTVSEAVKLLTARGLVETRGGSGTYVRRQRPVVNVIDSMTLPDGDGRRRSWREVVADAGMVGTMRALGAGMAAAPVEIAAQLGIEPNEMVAWRSRALLIDGEPVQIATSWHSPAITAALPILASPEKLPRMSPALMAEAGWSITHISDRTVARRASVADAEALRIEPRDPVLDVVRTCSTASGEVVDVTRMVTNSARLVWVTEKSS